MTTVADVKSDEGAAGGALLVLESYPPGLLPTGGALPSGSRWFHAACRRWGVAPTLLAGTARLNALDRPPQGDWLPGAAHRVGATLAARRPRLVIAAGWVAREAVACALHLRRRPVWAKPVHLHVPGLGSVVLLAVPHYSGRSRLLNCPVLRRVTSDLLNAALTSAPACLIARSIAEPQ